MANTINVTYKVNEDGSLEKISQNANRAAAATDNVTASTDRYNKKAKGVAGATSNSTKAFSKMSQGISGGLVPAYAVLAANVFAVTAAFGVLQRSSAVRQLNEGLLFTGRAAGQNLPLVSKGLVEITGHAISTAEAMRAVALGTSAGFSETQLKGLAAVAKGAAQALGRDVPDAIDRLTRGAAKLEPEILDELGIMVRLDDVTTEYAASLGKAADKLSNFERRQAFANAIIEQGNQKFGALGKAVESNPYDKLAATFDNLVKTFVSGINTVLGPIVGFFADNMMSLIGAIGIFSISVVRTMVPALTEGGSAMAAASKNAASLAKENLASIKTFKGAPKIFEELSQKVANGTATLEERKKLTTSLDRSIKAHNNTMEASIANHGRESKVVTEKKATLAKVVVARNAVTAATNADTVALQMHTRATAMDAAASGNLREMLTLLRTAWVTELAANTAANIGATTGTKVFNTLRVVLGLTTFSIKALGTAFLVAIPYIGLITMAVGSLYALFKKDPVEGKWDAVMAKAQERYAEFPNILAQLATSYEAAQTAAERFALSIAVTTGLMQQLKTQMLDIINLEKQSERQSVVAARMEVRRLTQERDAINEKREAAKKALEEQTRSETRTSRGQPIKSSKKGPTPIPFSVELSTANFNLNTAQAALDEANRALGILDPKTLEGVTGVLIQGQLNFEQLARGAKAGSEELIFAQKQLNGVTALLKELEESDRSPEAIQAIYEKFNALEIQATATRGSLEAAKEAVSAVEALFAKGAARAGEFATELTVLDRVVSDMGSSGGFKQIEEAYRKALDAFGVKDKEGLIALQARVDAFNAEAKIRGVIAEGYSTFANSERTAGLEMNALQLEQTLLRDETRFAQERLAIAIKLQVNEEEALLGVLKAQSAERAKAVAISKQKIVDVTRLGGADMGATMGASESISLNMDKFKAAKTSEKFKMVGDAMKPMMDNIKALGPEGELVSAITAGAFAMGEAFNVLSEKVGGAGATMGDKLQFAGAAINSISNIVAAASQAKIAGIDAEISAEQKRDGKSAASIARIKALEKKKEGAQRKAFEMNKKLQMAQVAIAVASSIAHNITAASTAAAASGPAAPGVFAGVLGMMNAVTLGLGAAQIAIIAGTSFQGGGSAGAGAGAGPSSISIGNRENSVDLAKARSPSGEQAYARGSAGTGSGMTNYTPAFTGMKYRASGGNTGFMVGEQGPEIFTPDRPGRITPADEVAGMGAPMNVNFTIQAIDAQGIEQVLNSQRGNLIGMIREAANAHGEEFLENVNVQAYQGSAGGGRQYDGTSGLKSK